MADEIDDAQEMTDLHIARSLAKINTKTLAYSGSCLFCGDDCGTSRRYCNRDCREDHEREQRQFRRFGGMVVP